MDFVRLAILPAMLIALLAQSGFAQPEAKKLSRSEALASVLTKVQPEYPVIAKQLKVHGVAELEAVIAEDGTVEKVTIVSGNPMLTKPATEALKRWKFKPVSVDGKPVKAVAPVSFAFEI